MTPFEIVVKISALLDKAKLQSDLDTIPASIGRTIQNMPAIELPKLEIPEIDIPKIELPDFDIPTVKGVSELALDFERAAKAAQALEAEQKSALAAVIAAGGEGSDQYVDLVAGILDAKQQSAELASAQQKVNDLFKDLEPPTLPEPPNPQSFVDVAAKFEALGKAGEFLDGISEKGVAVRDAMLNLEAQTGANAEELERLRDVADQTFRVGVGESVADAIKAVATAKQQLGGALDDTGITDFVSRAGAVSQVFDKDINEVIGKSRTFITNFGLDGQKAGDLISFAMQQAGNGMDDVLDTTDEYSQLVKEAGFSAEQFVSILTTGVQAGVRDTDKLADAIKETQIRLKAGDTSTALKGITGPVADTIKEIVKAGEAGKLSVQQVLQQSAAAIDTAFDAGKISDSMRNKLMVAVSGTPAEDIGAELYTQIFSAPIDEAAIGAAAAAAGAQMQNALGPVNFFEGLSRDLEAVAASASETFAPFIGGAGSALQTAGQLGPALTLVQNNFDTISGVVSKAGSSLLSFATNPVTLTIAAVAGVALAVHAFTDTTEELLQKQADAGEAQLKLVENQKKGLETQVAQTRQLPQLAAEYERLGTKTNRTAAEERQMTEVKLKLGRTYPGLIDSTKSFGENLTAVSAQAGKTKETIAGLTSQIEALDKRAREIANANRRIQAEILQEQITTALFSAQAGTLDAMDQAINHFFGGKSGALEGFQKQLQGAFKELIDSQTEQDVERRIGNFRSAILEAASRADSGISKEAQQQIDAQLQQLGTLLTSRFKATEEAAKTTAGAVTEVTDAEVARDNSEQLRFEAAKTRAATRISLIRDELAQQLAKNASDIALLQQQQQTERKALDLEISSGKVKAAERSALATKQKAETEKLETDRTLIIQKAREKLGSDILEQDAKLHATEIESIRIAGEQIVGEDAAALQKRLDNRLHLLREQNDAALAEAVRGSKEFKEFVSSGSSTDVDALLAAQVKLAEAIAGGDAATIEASRAGVDAAAGKLNDRIRALYQEFLGTALRGSSTLSKQLQNTIEAGVTEEFQARDEASGKIATLHRRERIAEITDLNEQEKQLALLAVDEQLEAELQKNRGNAAKIEQLTEEAAEKKREIERKYRDDSSELISVGLDVQRSLFRDFFADVSDGRRADLLDQKATLELQREQLKESLLRGSIDINEYNDQVTQISTKLGDLQTQLGDETVTFWDKVASGAIAAMETIENTQREKLVKSSETLNKHLTSLIEGHKGSLAQVEKDLEKVGTHASATVVAIWGQMAASGRATLGDFADAAILTSLQTIRTAVEGNVVAIIAAAFAVNPFLGIGSIVGVLAVEALLAKWEADAQSRLGNHGFHEGGHTGHGPEWGVAGVVHFEEIVLPKRIVEIPGNREVADLMLSGRPREQWLPELGLVTFTDLENLYIDITGQLRTGFEQIGYDTAMSILYSEQQSIVTTQELERQRQIWRAGTVAVAGWDELLKGQRAGNDELRAIKTEMESLHKDIVHTKEIQLRYFNHRKEIEFTKKYEFRDFIGRKNRSTSLSKQLDELLQELKKKQNGR